MPNRDRTGPEGKGAMTGRGQGVGRGSGRRQGRGLGFKRWFESTLSKDYCICPSCGHKVKHELGQPCYEQKCPNCETKMNRE